MKTFYFTEKELKEYNENIHYLKIDLSKNLNKPVFVLAVAGINAYWKLKKIIGSEDTGYAKKNQKKSINAIFYSKNNDTVLMTDDKNSTQK
jgi:hypothetical protein